MLFSPTIIYALVFGLCVFAAMASAILLIAMLVTTAPAFGYKEVEELIDTTVLGELRLSAARVVRVGMIGLAGIWLASIATGAVLISLGSMHSVIFMLTAIFSLMTIYSAAGLRRLERRFERLTGFSTTEATVRYGEATS